MGLKALLDTNAIIALLKNEGNLSKTLSNYSEVYVSVISVLEFQSLNDIDTSDLVLFDLFKSRIIIVDLTHRHHQLIETIISIRKIKKFKLPDAIIAATSIVLKSDLFTADKNFSKIKELNIITW